NPARANVMTPNGQASRSAGQHVRPNIRTKVWLDVNGRFLIGEGGAALLTAVAARGSLAEGARDIGWSYLHAWGYLRRAESVLGARLTTTRQGKGAARGTALTSTGLGVIDQLLDVRRRLDALV